MIVTIGTGTTHILLKELCTFHANVKRPLYLYCSAISMHYRTDHYLNVI